jgi:lysylphosphatidylglycerol synthetase-like protein (DUF2156 family)
MEKQQTANDEEVQVAPQQENKQPGPKRSLAVSIVSWFHIIQGTLLLINSMFVLSGLANSHIGLNELFDQINHDHMLALTVIFFLLGILTVIMGMGLRTLRPWAWLAAMLVQGANLVTSLFAYFSHTPDYFTMIFGVLIVFLLNQREVRHAFRLWETQFV